MEVLTHYQSIKPNKYQYKNISRNQLGKIPENRFKHIHRRAAYINNQQKMQCSKYLIHSQAQYGEYYM
jgi:hypothetical protein